MRQQPLLGQSFAYKQQNPSYIGQQFDARYSRGTVQQRKCTDLFCCILFLVLIGGMIFVGYLGFKTGNPKLLASPFDEDGKQCGVDPGYENFQKIFISFMNDDPTDIGFVCTKQCPLNENSTLDCVPNSQVPTCDSLKIYQAKTVVNLCYPSDQIINTFDFNHYMDVSNLQKYFSDLKNGWPLIGACAFFAFFVSVLFALFIRHCAGCFVWVTIILFWVLMVIVGTSSFLIDRIQFLQKLVHYNDLPQNLRDRDYQLACAIICWTLAFLESIVIYCFSKQIRICTYAIGILKASADFTHSQCQALLIPVYITIMQVLFLAAWLTTILYIFSSSESEIEPVEKTPFGFVVFNRSIQLYSILYLFGLLWIMFFFDALQCYWTCSAVALWFFQQGNPSSPIFRSISRSLKQVGSIAFGSLVISLVVFLRTVMEYFTKALKQQTLGMEQQAGPVQFLLKCASCYIACFERIIRFLTKNAYIMMAISGKSFCQSAKQSFYLMVKCTMLFTISAGTTKIFTTIGKNMIVAICCLCGYFLLTQIQVFKKSIYSPIFLTILFAIVSYPIASAFLGLFEMASNTILMCYCLQIETRKGENPWCPIGLRNFLKTYTNQSVSSSSQVLK